MNAEHVISSEAFDRIKTELLEGNQWLAYNTASHFLENHDVYLFNSKDKAIDFAESNVSESDSYHVIHIASINDVFKQISYGNRLSKVPEQRKVNKPNSFTTNSINMNQKNFEYLKDQVKYTGFGDELANTIKERMQKEPPQFHIVHDAKIGNESFFTMLHFKKSEKSDMYFFNKYRLEIKFEGSQEKMSQGFYINKGNNITLKEAYNLMNGRAVNKDLINKEGQVYNTWVKLDYKNTDTIGDYKMKHYHSNYGFDLDKVLSKHPIKELANEEDKTRLIESLQKGNRQSVTFLEGGKENKMFIEANPQFKSINVYDNNMQRVQLQSKKESNSSELSTKQETKKEKQGQQDEDSGDIPKAKQKNKKSKKQSL